MQRPPTQVAMASEFGTSVHRFVSATVCKLGRVSRCQENLQEAPVLYQSEGDAHNILETRMSRRLKNFN